MHLFLYGILMGWGAAIPIGPINIEIMRRNLQWGTPRGLVFGMGACLADVTYLALFGFGASTLLQHPEVLREIGIAGSLILGWFGVMALRMKPSHHTRQAKPRSFLLDTSAGYLMTLLNPYNVLFWSSLIAQVALISQSESYGLVQAGGGVLFGALSWVVFINLLLHFTRHRIPQGVTKYLNIVGGIILIAFGVFGLIRAFF